MVSLHSRLALICWWSHVRFFLDFSPSRIPWMNLLVCCTAYKDIQYTAEQSKVAHICTQNIFQSFKAIPCVRWHICTSVGLHIFRKNLHLPPANNSFLNNLHIKKHTIVTDSRQPIHVPRTCVYSKNRKHNDYNLCIMVVWCALCMFSCERKQMNPYFHPYTTYRQHNHSEMDEPDAFALCLFA